MWTPRRVLFLILGMVLFGTAFGIYARFLGWIDGLPELPEELLVRRAVDEVPPELNVSPVEAKLQQAFGADCVEATNKYNIKLEHRAMGIALAAGDFGIDPEGRVKFWPFSLATFKERPGSLPEINIIHSDIAYLEFDRPVRSVAEMASRRIVGCQLESDPHEMSNDPRRGKIRVVNNRGTRTADDDLVLETPGPVHYREAAHPNLPLDKAIPQLKTAAAVQMVDHRHQADATTIDAQGMEVYLAVEPPESDAAVSRKPKSRGSAVAGVRRVVLPANVRMNLWIDPKEGFLSTAAKPQPKAAVGPAKPAEPSHVVITTLGPFTYDVLPDGDKARFDRLPAAATQLPNCVRVVRPLVRGPGTELNDQLECDTLELRFTQKQATAEPGGPVRPKSAGRKDEERQALEWVHAWGQFIVLTSDEEKLEARGTDLFYNARTKATTLKGLPEMVAVKDGNEIHAPELTLYGTEAKEGRHAEARGPGRFRLLDRAATKRTVEARWRDLMVFRQEEGQDLLTLSGDAMFDDQQNKQELRADQLKLLLAQDAKAQPVAAKPAATMTSPAPSKVRPQRLEATGHVTARSPDIVIHDTEQLVLLFKDLPPGPVRAAPAGSGNSPWTTPVQPNTPPAAGGKPVPQPPPKKPIDVAARTVQAFVNRQGELNVLDVVHCEGDVRVHQDPVPPQEKPVDMRGRALKLKHTPEGSVLTVTGTVTAPGEVHTPDLSLIGPFIVIDQVENVAEVQGLGSMKMVSTTDFEGKKLKEPTPLTISWKQGMKFTGPHARFHGLVQADQQDTTLLCQTMQVYLNRPVSLSQRPGQARGDQKEPANVDKVVCEAGDRPQGVMIKETKLEDGRLISTKWVEADEVAIYKDEGRMVAANHGNARGNVRIVQLGPKKEPGGGPRPPAGGTPKPTELEYKLTWVRYSGTMNVKNQSRTAHFYDGVEVLHLPLDAADRLPAFDTTVNRLPAGALHLRATQMTVYSAKDATGQTRQAMTAEGKAEVLWGEEFFGKADVIRFDEVKEQMTMEGLNGGIAVARRLRPKPGEPSTMRARKIIYNRRDDSILMDGVYSATGD